MTEDLPIVMLPTSHRDKHRKEVSFPLGARDISIGLAGVPQFSLMTLSFHGGNQQQNLHLKPRFRVFSVLYRRRALTHNDGAVAKSSGVLDPKWHVSVAVVPVAFRRAIKSLLLEKLEHVVRPWLMDAAQQPDAIGELAMSFDYDVASGALIQSTSNTKEPTRS
jgi:hypothetical protein